MNIAKQFNIGYIIQDILWRHSTIVNNITLVNIVLYRPVVATLRSNEKV